MVEREHPAQMIEFAAYETIGAAIPHVMPVYKTDDPELMKALGDAIASGRVVLDEVGNVVAIDGVPYDEWLKKEE